MDKNKAAEDIHSDVTNISDSKNTIQELRSWQRFHIRLTALYGGAMIITLAILAVNVYFSDLDSEFKGLQQKIEQLKLFDPFRQTIPNIFSLSILRRIPGLPIHETWP